MEAIFIIAYQISITYLCPDGMKECRLLFSNFIKKGGEIGLYETLATIQLK